MIGTCYNIQSRRALDRIPDNPDPGTGLYLQHWLEPKPVGSLTFNYTPKPGFIGPTSWTTGENPRASAGSQWHDFSGGLQPIGSQVALAGSGDSKSPLLALGIGAAIFIFMMRGKLLR